MIKLTTRDEMIGQFVELFVPAERAREAHEALGLIAASLETEAEIKGLKSAQEMLERNTRST